MHLQTPSSVGLGSPAGGGPAASSGPAAGVGLTSAIGLAPGIGQRIVSLDRYDWLALVVAVASTGIAVAYLWRWPAYDLTPDEAHYWDWSRRLDWSYYSKGPLVAWLIRLADELGGAWSLAATGERTAAIRSVAAACHFLLLCGWYVLARMVFGGRVGVWVVLLAAMIPLTRIGAVLMTIDPPLLACWCWGLVGVVSALRYGRSGGWVLAAAGTAAGILAKYTMVLLPLGFAAYVLCHQRDRHAVRGLLWLGGGGLLGALPILVWNAQHDWVSLRHVLGQIGVQRPPSGGKGAGLLPFIAGQLGTMFGLWLFIFCAAAWRYRPWVVSPNCLAHKEIRLLWWVSAPVWGLFAAASLLKPGQPNWPAPAYVAGFVLGVAWLQERWMSGRLPRWFKTAVVVNILLGLVVAAMLHYPQSFRPLLARLLPPPSPSQPLPIRRLDFTARLAGWKALARTLDQHRQRLAEQGIEPVLCGTYWNQPGIIRFYCSGHPETYTIGIPNGSDRHSQYDLWRPNPVSDPGYFRGRTFLIVGDISPHIVAAFDRLEPPQELVYCENGVPLQRWTIWMAHGFRGFPPETLLNAAY